MTREQIEELRKERHWLHDDKLALLAAAERALLLEDVLAGIVEEWTAVASKLTCDVDYVGPLRAAIDRAEGKP